MNKNEPGKAFYYFEKAYTTDPDNNESLYNLGAYYLNAGQKEKALPFFKKAFELGNSSAGKYLTGSR